MSYPFIEMSAPRGAQGGQRQVLAEKSSDGHDREAAEPGRRA